MGNQRRENGSNGRNKVSQLGTARQQAAAAAAATYERPLHPRVCTPTRTATASGWPLMSSLMRAAARSVIVMGSRSWSLLRAGFMASGASPMITRPAAFERKRSVNRMSKSTDHRDGRLDSGPVHTEEEAHIRKGKQTAWANGDKISNEENEICWAKNTRTAPWAQHNKTVVFVYHKILNK